MAWYVVDSIPQIAEVLERMGQDIWHHDYFVMMKDDPYISDKTLLPRT